MLTFDGVWHAGVAFCSRMSLYFHCSEQMADSACGVVWVTGLLTSTLWIERLMVAVEFWYGQVYVQLCTAIVDQHSTAHNQQPEQCNGDVLHCVRQMMATPAGADLEGWHGVASATLK